MKNDFSYYPILVLLLILLAGGCGNHSEEEAENPLSEEEQESAEVRPEVIFAVADDQPVFQYVQSQGVVEANRQVVLKLRNSGFVKTSRIMEGRWVEKGDTLLALEQDEWQYAVDDAQIAYEEALSAYRIEKRLRGNLTGGIGSGDQDSSRSDAMVRISNGLAQAEVELKRAKMNLEFATLLAPFSGTIAVGVDQRLSEGAYVASGTTVGQLVNDASVQVRFDVLESELGSISTGQSVRVLTPGGQSLNGVVTAVSPVVNTQSKTGEVIARVTNSQRLLRPGMTVEGRIVVQQADGKARIPRSAVLSRDGGRTLVFKLHPSNDEVEWIYVEPDAQNSDWAIVNNENIAPGDTLAVENHFSLSHLQIVSPKMQTMQREGEDSPEMDRQ